MNISEKLITIAENEQKIYNKGYYKGSDEGYVYGYDEGYWVGEEVGYSDGYNEGREEGYIEGYHKGGLDASPQETVSGEAIGIKDISPIEHNMGVSVRGKNLIPPQNSTVTVQGYTYDSTNGDGSFIINTVGDGSITSSKEVLGKNLHDLLVDGKTYTFAMDNFDKKPVAFVLATTRLSDNKPIYHVASSSNNFIQRFTIDKSTYRYDRMYLQINTTSEVFVNVVVKPILALGTYTELPFAPYIEDISTVKLLKQGKNLFNADLNTLSTITYITTSGTQSTRTGWEVELQAGVTYTVNAIPKNGDFTESYLYGCVTNSTDNLQISTSLVANKAVKSYTFTAEKGWKWKVYDGLAANPLSYTKKMMEQFYIQLEVGTKPTEIEEFIEPTVYDVSADGNVEGVKSLYPSTTLYTDTNGAVIDCTYYQDGKKVKENLIDMILSLGGVINE